MKKILLAIPFILILLLLMGCEPTPTQTDFVAPSFSGESSITYEIGDEIPDFSEYFTAFDVVDGDVTASIQIDDSEIDFLNPGTYGLILTVSDLSGNKSVLVVTIVVLDTTAPLITGAIDISYYIGDPAPDYMLGVSAYDFVDGNLTEQIIIDSSQVNLEVPGVYNLEYRVSDLSTNSSSSLVTVTVYRVIDTTLPVLSGVTSITYEIGDELPPYESLIHAIDDVDGDLSTFIIFNQENVNYMSSGTYVVVVTVSDFSGNMAQLEIEVIVDDTLPPGIYGVKDITYYIGQDLPDYLYRVVAIDLADGDLTDEIEINLSQVNLTTPGKYDISYRVVDGKNYQFSVSAKIIVIDLDSVEPINELSIYYINDLHGAIMYESEQMGLARIGNLVLDERSKNPDSTLFIGGGDLLQGTLISNYFNGASTINALNAIGMDAFVLGNHEFDWGFPLVTRYRNPYYIKDQLNSPILGANIFLDGTTTRPDFVDPYTIVQKGNIKVGIIGVMGFGLESSIAVSKIQGYYFANPVHWATYYTEYLRTVEQVDIVLVVLHDNGISTGFNQTMSQLSGNQKVDAVFNGHSHSSYTGTISRSGSTNMPYIQSSSNGKNLGRVRFTLDLGKNITAAAATNLIATSDSRLNVSNVQISTIIGSYEAEIQPLLTEVIMVSGAYMSQSTLSFYMAKLMRIATGSDVAFHNLGGTRAPIMNGQNITVATLYQIFPFDNKIKTTYLTGAQINAFINSSGGAYNDIKNNMTFDSATYYKVATNDYMFDQTYYPFINGINSEDTGILIRDVLEKVLRNQAKNYDSFLLTNPIVLGSSLSQLDVYILKSKDELNTLFA